MTEAFYPGYCVSLHDGDISRDFYIFDNRKTKTGLWYSMGGSAICYDAFFRDTDKPRRPGILKKFYLADDTLDFHEEAENYIKPYRELRWLISKDPENQQIYSFIQPFEIYYDQNQCPYIWTEGASITTFQEICETMMMNRDTVEEALFEIVRPLKALAKCLDILHAKGLIHGDINPRNFGFAVRNHAVLSDHISLFDLNTLRFVWQEPTRGTVPYYGIWNPEECSKPIYNNEQGNTADIRALGLTFCNALFCKEEDLLNLVLETDKIRPSSKKIEDILSNGYLFSQKGKPRNPKIIELITGIIKETVCPISEDNILCGKRISDCESLAREFDKLENFLLPSVQNNFERGMGLEIVNREEQRNNTVKSVYQRLLYDRPLYSWQNQDKTYNTVIFGFGPDGQNFLDICLESAQALSVPMVVHVFDNSIMSEEKKIYLEKRPALAQFFQIDGKEEELTGSSYGTIHFNVLKGTSLEEKVTKALHAIDSKVHYVLIATGNDKDNDLIGKMCLSIAPDACINSQRETEAILNDQDGIFHVYPNQTGDVSATHPELERMAFNAHLIWSGMLTAFLQKKKEKYNKDYFHKSNISAVLAIKYRLYALGIDPDQEGLCDAAEKVCQIFRKNPEIKEKLSAGEHRRWVTEKLCDGWTNMSIESSIQFLDTKDPVNKKHLCIVRGEEVRELDNWRDHRRWDSATAEELEQLDELDQLSIRYHQAYSQNKETFDKDLLYNNAQYTDAIISKLTGLNNRSLLLFKEWLQVTDEIYHDSYNPESLNRNTENLVIAYSDLYARLLEEIDEADEERNLKEFIKKQIRTLHEKNAPFVEIMRYRDFKKSDMDLIEAMPFIMTYRDDIVMIVRADHFSSPQEQVDATERFSWIGAATVINPIQLHLIVPPNGLKQRQQFRLRVLREYCKRKGLQTRISVFESDNYDSAVKAIRQETDEKHWVVADAEKLDGSMPMTGSFSFDSVRQIFTTSSNVAWLNYIPELYRTTERCVALTARDLACVLGCKQEVTDQPYISSADINKLFEIYLSNRKAWKELCHILKQKDDRYEKVASFSKGCDIALTNEFTRVLPLACKESVSLILEEMKNAHLINASSKLLPGSANRCTVQINGYSGQACELEQLFHFSNSELFTMEREYKLINYNQNAVLLCDKLHMKGIPFSSNSILREEIIRELSELQKSGFVFFSLLNDQLDIEYTSNQIKQVFMSEGAILEQYIYYKARSMACFDDVTTGFVLKNEDEALAEIDCLLIKGFQTIIIECKARENNSESELSGFVNELQRKIRLLGINGKGILFVDRCGKPLPALRLPDNIYLVSEDEKVKSPEQVFQNNL